MRIAHVALWTRDLEAAAAFWRRLFDATIGEPYASRRRPGFVSRQMSLPKGGEGGGGVIELMSGPWVGGARPECAGWDHVALALGSREAVDAMAARCRAAGCLLSAPRVTGDGFYEAVIITPDATRIEITV